MNIEDRVIDLIEDEYGEGKPRWVKSLSQYKFNGVTVPRVTVILSEMQSDQGLLRYSNFLGFKHIDYNQMLNNAASIGTETHAFIENYIQKKEENIPTRKEVNNCTEAFLKWWKMLNSNYNIKVLGEEQSLSCPWFGGTYDLLLDINGKKALVDFKTSNHITHRYFIQLAAYKYLISYNLNLQLDMCIILRMDKETANYEMVTLDLSIPEDMEFMDYCSYAFFSQVNNYYSLSRVKSVYNKLMKPSVAVNIPEDPKDLKE